MYHFTLLLMLHSSTVVILKCTSLLQNACNVTIVHAKCLLIKSLPLFLHHLFDDFQAVTTPQYLFITTDESPIEEPISHETDKP